MSLASSKLPLAAVSLAGVAMILFITLNGVGVTPNSVTYITGARSLLRGEGLLALDPVEGVLSPMTIHAPVYAACLAGIGWMGAEPVVAARWLNAFVFGASIFVMGWMVYGATGSRLRSFLAAFFFASSTNSLEIHSFAWSEPLFILLALLGLQALMLHLETGDRWILVLASAFLALMVLTRYAGAALVAGAALTILGTRERGWGRRIADVALLAFVACGPLVLWVARNTTSGAMAGGKPLAFHPLQAPHLEAATTSIASLVFPARAPGWARALVALAVVLGFAALLVTSLVQARAAGWPSRRRTATRTLATAVVSYAVFYLLYVSFVDWSLTLTGRLLAPLFALGVAQVMIGYQPGESAGKVRSAIRIAAHLIVAALCVFMLARIVRLAGASRLEGLDYSLTRFEDSDLVRAVRGLPEETLVYTNNAEYVHYLTGRLARSIPWLVNKYSLRENEAYGEEIGRMRGEMEAGRAVIVYIRNLDTYFTPSEESLTTALDLKLLTAGAEGEIFIAAPAP